MLAIVALHVLAVDLGAGGLSLAKGADVKIVIEDTLHGDDSPSRLHLPLVFLAAGFLAQLLGHTRGWHALFGEGIGNLLVTPAFLIVKVEDAADDLRFRGDNFKFLAFIDDISVGCGTDPLSILLATLDDVAHLL